VASTQPANGTAMSADDPWAEMPEKANQPAPRIPVCTQYDCACDHEVVEEVCTCEECPFQG
jgi:hypothetical protein